MKSAGWAILLLFLSVSAATAEVGGGDIVYKVDRTGDVVFRHDSHVTEFGFRCEDCHPAVFPMEKSKKGKYTMAEMRRHKACGVCHNGKNAFDVGQNCYVCHVK